jgi:hypothetical protein
VVTHIERSNHTQELTIGVHEMNGVTASLSQHLSQSCLFDHKRKSVELFLGQKTFDVTSSLYLLFYMSITNTSEIMIRDIAIILFPKPLKEMRSRRFFPRRTANRNNVRWNGFIPVENCLRHRNWTAP